MRNKKVCHSNPIQATDSKYLDDEFTSMLKKANEAACPDVYLHNLRQIYKEHVVVFIQRLVFRRPQVEKQFHHSDLICNFATQQQIGPHFVNCFFESYNTPALLHPEYNPSQYYHSRKVKGDAFRDSLQRILKDAIYTAKKYFTKLSTYNRTASPAQLDELAEIHKGMKYIANMFKFYFTAQIPKVLTIETYDKVFSLSPSIAEYYTMQGDHYRRKNGARVYGSYFLFGEHAAAHMFIDNYIRAHR